MTNITLSAPKELIDQARRTAAAKGTTLNEEFRIWLAQQAEKERAERVAMFKESLERVHFTSTRKFTREEMNER